MWLGIDARRAPHISFAHPTDPAAPDLHDIGTQSGKPQMIATARARLRQYPELVVIADALRTDVQSRQKLQEAEH
jgi:hypothetical protein